MEQRRIPSPCERDVLIVDDEAGVRELFAEVLREKGYADWRPQGDSNPCYRRERAVS